MITKELIAEVAALSGLTPEQIAAIELLSKNDENNVIAEKTKTFHDKYDQTIFEATGIQKTGSEKSYDYLTRAAGSLRVEATEAPKHKARLTELEQELAALKASKGDETIQKELRTAKADLETVRAALVESQKTLETTKENYENEKKTDNLNSAIAKGFVGLKYKADVKPEIVALVEGNIRAKLAGIPSEVDANGTVIFRNSDGTTMLNKANSLAPFTVAELVRQELSPLGLLDDKPKPTGAGGTPSGGTKGGSLDLSAATTQIQANELIDKHLMENGYIRSTKEFQDQKNQIYTENSIVELPEQ